MTREEQIEKEANRVSWDSDEYHSFIEGAEWADAHPPQGTSVIKWKTGEPNINGAFLVAYKNSVCKFERKRGFWMYCGLIINDKDVVAWCKLSDIKPYKEEQK